MQDSLVSIIIPTYNRRHTLARALDSVLAQSHSQLELIVVDDGSTDDTVRFLLQHYPQVQVFSQPQQGVSAARNLGIRAATGSWIALLDSDDCWKSDKLSLQLAALAKSNDRWCHTQELWYRHGVRVSAMHKYRKCGGKVYLDCLPLCCISPSSVLMHRTLFDDYGYFNEQLPACEDYDLWLRITTFESVTFLSDPLTIKYGGHEDQLSKKYWGMDRFRLTALYDRLSDPALPEAYRLQTESVFKKKLAIVCKGAQKRNNQQLLNDLADQYVEYAGSD
jgi:glycosyltransferase involved in cell wall biosynthesis